MSPRASGLGWGRSYRLAEFFGIEVFVHWTFAALIGVVSLSVLAQTGSLAAVGNVLIPLVLAFGCVVLHEYGHALTARFFGIQTRGITLLPIGGIAELQRSPNNPKQELVIALAGPAVNFALAILLIALVRGSDAGQQLLLGGSRDSSVLDWLIRLNLILGTFNLLPALPMDGGRILRAALSLKMPALRATRISATTARGIAALMVIFGLGRGDWMIAFIGFFVWTAARSELRQAAVLAKRRTQSPEEPRRTVSRAQRDDPQNVEIEMRKGATGEWDRPHSDPRYRRSD